MLYAAWPSGAKLPSTSIYSRNWVYSQERYIFSPTSCIVASTLGREVDSNNFEFRTLLHLLPYPERKRWRELKNFADLGKMGKNRRWVELIMVLAAGVVLLAGLARVVVVEGTSEDLSSIFLGDDEGEANSVDQQIEVLDEKDVVVLESANFSEFVKSTQFVLVEFYASWCGHCKNLAPEYAEAATVLKGKAALAKVDGTTNNKLAEEYGVNGYPTMIFFIEGEEYRYSGGRVKDEIVAWVKKKTGPPVLRVNSKKDAEKVFSSLKATVAIALLDSLEGSETEEYTFVARQMDDIHFIETGCGEVANVFNFPKDVKRPALVLLKQTPEKVSWFDGPFTRDAIEAFLAKNKLPLVTTFNNETSAMIFASSIKKQVFLFTGADDYKRLIPDFMESAKAFLGRLVFVHVDLEQPEQAPGVLEYFGITGNKPVIMGYSSEEGPQKYLLEQKITTKNVKAFGEKLLSGSLNVYLKSDPIPETNDGDVKTVVSLNLDDIVLDETKDVFLEIYAPWCGHCKTLEPLWERLAKRLRGVESILIAKMDGTTNEHAHVKWESYPTLLLYPAGRNGADPISYKGERTVKEFVKFLKKEATIPFGDSRDPDGLSHSETAKVPEDSPDPESVVEESFDSRKDEL